MVTLIPFIMIMMMSMKIHLTQKLSVMGIVEMDDNKSETAWRIYDHNHDHEDYEESLLKRISTEAANDG